MVPLMTTPDNSKTARFSAYAHRALMELASDIGGTADDALRHLLGQSTIRVPVTEVQRMRWIKAGQAAGVPVDEFVRLRVEAALQVGADPATLQLIYRDVDALCQHAGLRLQPVNPQSTAPAPRRQLSTPKPEPK